MPDHADKAVLLVGHGSSTHASAAACFSRHAENLREHGAFADVGYATLNGGPNPEDALAKFDGVKRILIIPYFMTDGYLSRLATTSRLGRYQHDPRISVCPPIGMSPELVGLGGDTAEEYRARNGWTRNEWDLLLVAHGSSKDLASRRGTEKFAAGIGGGTSAKSVVISFIEEAPFVGDVAKELKRPTIVMGLFAAPGGHALDDVPEALENSPVPVDYTGAIGGHSKMIDVIMATLKGAEQDIAVAS